MILKAKEAYNFWLILHRDFPRTERFGLGQKIENIFLDILEFSFLCIYLQLETKIVLLGKIISKMDILKFFVQLAWESKIIPNDKYIILSAKLEEIGKMLGGWKKGLESKKEAI